MTHPLLCPYCGRENNPLFDLIAGDYMQCEHCHRDCLISVATVLLPDQSSTRPNDPLGLDIHIGDIDA